VARPPVQALAGAAYLAALLAVDHAASRSGQLALGLLTWAVLLAALSRLSLETRVQTVGVVAFATVGEVTGSLIWGVYRYRLHNLPLFIPPAHGIVYLTGLALATSLRRHVGALVGVAAATAAGWGLLGLTVLPRRDVAGAIGVPLLLLFLWRSRNRPIYAAVFLVVACLELYGTALGTWRRQPGRRGATEAVSRGEANAAAAERRRRCSATYQAMSSGTTSSPSRTAGAAKLTASGPDGRRASPPRSS